jgi:hypothetical protein
MHDTMTALLREFVGGASVGAAGEGAIVFRTVGVAPRP